MADTRLVLGGVTFRGFEIPERIVLPAAPSPSTGISRLAANASLTTGVPSQEQLAAALQAASAYGPNCLRRRLVYNQGLPRSREADLVADPCWRKSLQGLKGVARPIMNIGHAQ